MCPIDKIQLLFPLISMQMHPCIHTAPHCAYFKVEVLSLWTEWRGFSLTFEFQKIPLSLDILKTGDLETKPYPHLPCQVG